MLRWFGVFGFLLVTGGLLAAGCGNSVSDSVAATYCQQEQMAKTQCFSPDSYTSCLNCYESCGTDCAAQETCPEEYKCP